MIDGLIRLNTGGWDTALLAQIAQNLAVIADVMMADHKTEPTISKMEQVEPQTCSFSDCDNFKNPDYERCIECKRKQIKLKTEQTERSSEWQADGAICR